MSRLVPFATLIIIAYQLLVCYHSLLPYTKHKLANELCIHLDRASLHIYQVGSYENLFHPCQVHSRFINMNEELKSNPCGTGKC